ncbi:MAG: mitochondrial import inner membrane translocase subunit tim54 [Pycnora praestabilis]|nr:MAG: mitochondrial import inner membrane translocase subunit tim54 [Pycnora praestabilis]
MANPTPPALGDVPPNPSSNVAPNVTQPKRNPAFKMMVEKRNLIATGLPNFRFKLPSRNWLIFLSITGSFTSLLLYDKYQTKQAKRKWCTVVSHLASEPLSVSSMPRKLTVYLSAPPGDGLRSAREYFQEYVKPVLVSAALDWEVVEGRREGEVRSGLAEKVRRLRRMRGEHGDMELKGDAESMIEQTRQKAGISEYDGVKGDIVIGRHTWKEYIRGLHEGWLGPLDPPSPPSPSSPALAIETPTPDTSSPPDAFSPLDDVSKSDANEDDASPTAPTPTPPPPEPPTEPTKPAKPTQIPPFIFPPAYFSSDLPPTLPSELEPSAPLPFPHILGFFNTPIRTYRFLTRRRLADDVGRQTAAVVFAASRPYQQSSSFSTTSSTFANDSNDASDQGVVIEGQYEQRRLLAHEESEWHKSARKRKEGEEGERVWSDDVVLDPRIVSRMRRFELDPVEEARALRIAKGKQEEGEEPPKPAASWWMNLLGGQKKENVVVVKCEGDEE